MHGFIIIRLLTHNEKVMREKKTSKTGVCTERKLLFKKHDLRTHIR